MIEKKIEKTEQLLQLIKENPGLRVFPMVDTEIVADDQYTWWAGSFGSSAIEEIYMDDERYYIRSEHEDELVDDVFNGTELFENVYIPLPGVTDEMRAREIVSRYPWEKVIAVYINTP